MAHSIETKYVERFLTLVGEPDENGCRVWLGRPLKGRDGEPRYGQMALSGRNKDSDGVEHRIRDLAHRIAWRVANNQDIPSGMVIRHSCDNMLCCHDGHLLLGTHADNIDDMMSRGRWSGGKKRFFSEYDLQGMRALRAEGETLKAIAMMYGDCSIATISKYLSGHLLPYTEEIKS
jgi:hypothetical protein